MGVISITPGLWIDEAELSFAYARASGPGGQHVNKVETAVQLRFDVANSPSLSEGVRRRLLDIGGNRVTSDGVLVIEASGSRSRERNRAEAVERLVALTARAATPPRPRRPTRPTRASRRRRLDAKRKRGDTKRMRGRVRPGDD